MRHSVSFHARECFPGLCYQIAFDRAADSYRLRANREPDLPQVTIGGVLDRYERECVEPFVNVLIGGSFNANPAPMCPHLPQFHPQVAAPPLERLFDH